MVGSYTLTLPCSDRQPLVSAIRSTFTDEAIAGPCQSSSPLISRLDLPAWEGATSITAPRTGRAGPTSLAARDSGPVGRGPGASVATRRPWTRPRMNRPGVGPSTRIGVRSASWAMRASASTPRRIRRSNPSRRSWPRAQPPPGCGDRRDRGHGGARPVQHWAGEPRRRRLRPRSGGVGEGVGDPGQCLDRLLAADPEALTADGGGEPGAGHTGPHHGDGGETDDQGHPLAERQVIHLATRWRRRAFGTAHPRLQAESLAAGRQLGRRAVPNSRLGRGSSDRVTPSAIGCRDQVRRRRSDTGSDAAPPIGYGDRAIGCTSAPIGRVRPRIADRMVGSDVAYDVASDPRSSPSSA